MLEKEQRIVKPHEAFFTDLSKWITDHRTNQMEVPLWLNANERWHFNSEVAQFACRFELVNINKEMRLPDTHPNIVDLRRSTTIDYGLGT